MKILVLGAGAIGGYYGARLIEAGADVTFLVREQRKRSMQARGLQVFGASGNFDQQVKLVTEDAVGGDYELVLLACKTYDLAQTSDAIAPVMASGASVLPLLNGLGAYRYLDERFGRDRVLGGVAYIATTLAGDGAIHQLASQDTLIVGARSPSARELAQAFHALAKRTPGVRSLTDNIDQALWNKWVMLASGAIMCCLMRGTVGDILATRAGRQLMEQAMDECSAVASHAGFALEETTLTDMRARLLDPGSDWAASMMRDIDQNRPKLEADGIVGDMLSLATQSGLACTLTAAAYSHLQVYLARRARTEGQP